MVNKRNTKEKNNKLCERSKQTLEDSLQLRNREVQRGLQWEVVLKQERSPPTELTEESPLTGQTCKYHHQVFSKV